MKTGGAGKGDRRRHARQRDLRVQRNPRCLSALPGETPVERIYLCRRKHCRVPEGEAFAVVENRGCGRLAGKLRRPALVVILQVSAREKRMPSIRREVVVEPGNVGVELAFLISRKAKSGSIQSIPYRRVIWHRIVLQYRQDGRTVADP